MNIGIIGLGLIGGSMAKAVKTHTEHTVYGCDKIESIQNRLVVYRKSTAPLIDFYKSKGNLVDVDAKPAPETVLKEFETKFPKA